MSDVCFLFRGRWEILLRSAAAACEQQIQTFVGDYLGGLEEEAAVLQVHHLSFQLVLHHIHQGQFISQLLHTSGRFRTTHTTMLPLTVQSFTNLPVL